MLWGFRWFVVHRASSLAQPRRNIEVSGTHTGWRPCLVQGLTGLFSSLVFLLKCRAVGGRREHSHRETVLFVELVTALDTFRSFCMV